MQPAATLLAAFIGAFTAALISTIASARQHATAVQLELSKLTAANVHAHSGATRLAVADVSRGLSVLVKELLWMGWMAEKDRDAVTEGEARTYDARVREVVPQLMGSLSVVAALDEATYRQLEPMVRVAIDLEEAMASALREIRIARSEGLNAMLETYRRAGYFWDGFRTNLTGLSGKGELPQFVRDMLELHPRAVKPAALGTPTPPG